MSWFPEGHTYKPVAWPSSIVIHVLWDTDMYTATRVQRGESHVLFYANGMHSVLAHVETRARPESCKRGPENQGQWAVLIVLEAGACGCFLCACSLQHF